MGTRKMRFATVVAGVESERVVIITTPVDARLPRMLRIGLAASDVGTAKQGDECEVDIAFNAEDAFTSATVRLGTAQ